MLSSPLALAIAAAIFLTQGARTASGNYSGLEKIITSTAFEVRQISPQAPLAGLVIAPGSTQVYGTVEEDARRVVQRGPCGMPILVADASSDPRIIVPIPGSEKPEPGAATSEPPRCGPFAAVPANRPQRRPDSRR